MKSIWFAGVLALAATGQALAADLPPAGPPPRAPAAYVPAAAPVYDWGGIYVGLNAGYAFGDSNWGSPASTGSFSADGALVGGTLGVNFQANQFVFGVEGDIDWQDLDGKVANSVCGTGVSCQSESEWLGTVRGRVGFALDRVLFYGTAGGAFGDVQTGLNPGSLSSATKFGWTAGAGVEVAFFQNWSAKVEYLFVDLGDTSCSASCGTLAAGSSVSFNENIVRVGVNYKFGGF